MEYLQYAFFRNALLGIIIISIAGGIIGTYIITRRLVSITGGVTHACFGGLGMGYFLGVNPVAMASVFAIASSLSVEWISHRYHVREDSAIAVIWALGMAVGILFVFMTPGYVPELNGFLFGNILTITSSDLWAFSIFTGILLLFIGCFNKLVLACAFDSDFAKVSGLRVRLINYAMTVFVAVCVVLTIRLVGIMLLIALLTLPILIAETWVRRFSGIMVASVAISAATSVGGLLLSTLGDVPCSAIIVLLQVTVYVAARVSKDISQRRAMQ
ncbi:MAG: metal ABC transporter permease [Bacteroides sp.]|nr:metal ABC transporter permease [Lachnospiraceae bacterium]MCM1332315.1 metal ABC transporter permease [Bacteroides sp.]MCM1390562.1 metal ABC transporter permease [Bacteroides sp.]